MKSLMPRMFAEVGDWFDTDFGQLIGHPMRVEDYHEKDNYVIRAELPGLDPERDIKLSIDGDVLTVEAERSEETHDKFRSEFRYGSMSRSIRLPAMAQRDKISARYEKGILEITVPLGVTEPATRAIPVKHG